MSDEIESFYGELASGDGEILKRMISAGGGKCNILLYGAPGTGKTEFVKYLGDSVTNADYIEALKEECDVKKDCDGLATIGFGS